MNSRRRYLYDVEEWPGFEDAAIRVLGSISRWEAVKDYIDQYIAKEPRIGQRISRTNLYALSLETNPPSTIFYSIENETLDAQGHETGTIMLRDIQEV
jgi:hypothetical protein